MLERIAWYKARLHVQAYLEERDPVHIVDACIAFTEAGLPVAVEMHGNLLLLRKALRDAKGTAYRDVLILRRLLVEFRSRDPEVPTTIPATTISELEREHGMTRRAVITAISRIRKKLR